MVKFSILCLLSFGIVFCECSDGPTPGRSDLQSGFEQKYNVNGRARKSNRWVGDRAHNPKLYHLIIKDHDNISVQFGMGLKTALTVNLSEMGAEFYGRSFVINYERNSFYMDGKPFRYVSGSAHYFRMPNEYWRDRLRKIRAAGLNAVSTYVEWSQHEPVKGNYNFSGDLDIKKFIQIAHEEDLYVILRPGPYICAERDMGGLPYWLLTKHPDIVLRTQDPKYTKHVEEWMNVLLNEVSPLLYGRGGPIIMVQVENEYGSYHICDKDHTIWLRNLFKKHIKNDAVLFTTDGASKTFLKCGKIPDVYATVDFGANFDVSEAFRQQRAFEPKGPLINSEYYPGWLTHWGEKMARQSTNMVVTTLKKMLDMGANVNFYMFYGGTNFGFTAGANYGNRYVSDITSYDYDAPISEAGDITPKYKAIQELLAQYLPSPNITVESCEKGDYGEITLRRVATLFSPRIRRTMGVFHHNKTLRTFEALNQNFGYLLYETEIPKHAFNSTNGTLHIKKLRDIAHVYLQGNLLGNLSREFQQSSLFIKKIEDRGILSILVENLGRINFGMYLNDTKGILSYVSIEGKELNSWDMTSFQLNDVKPVEDCATENKTIKECDNGKGFVFYITKFTLSPKATTGYNLDTFLDVSHLTKGVVFLNGFNLGRYWSWRGPQYTLYVPGVYLNSHPEENTLIIMEENITMESIKIKFRKTPIFT